MDINGFSRQPLNMADSNPGKVSYCPGGVGRNIAENLHRLGAEVRFIGAIGNDPGGQFLKDSSFKMGLDIKHSLFLESTGPVTSVYIALMDSNGEMRLALADMDIMDKLTQEHLESKAKIIEESAIVLLDTNLPEKIICYLVDRFGSRPGKTQPLFFLDLVSARKAPRAASRIGSFDTLKLGRMEASALSGVKIRVTDTEKGAPGAEKALKAAASWFIEKGVRRVFITLGKDGVYLASGTSGAGGSRKSFFRPVHYAVPQNTSGAGDAFMAGIVYGTLQGWDDETTASFSLAMARITVQSALTVSPDLCLEMVMNTMMNSGG